MPGGLHPPWTVIASWPEANYVNPERRDWSLVALCIALFVITLIVVCARLWARLMVGRNAGLDDALIAGAMVPLAGLAISISLCSKVYGFDIHVWDQTLKQSIESRQITLAIEMFYMLSTTPAKVSILCFYRRMAAGSISKTFLLVVWIAMASIVCYGLGFILTLVFTCQPTAAFWMYVDIAWDASHEYKCINEAAELISAAVISIAQDIVTCLIPLLLIKDLQLPKRQKIAVASIFGIGLLTCVAGTLRIRYIYEVYYQTYDISWASQPAWAWTAVEAHLTFICASVPALKVFFRRYFNLSANRSNYGPAHSLGYIKNTFTGRPTVGSSRLSRSLSNPYSTKGGESGIKISRAMDVTVETRDLESDYPSSDRSSGELTSLPRISRNQVIISTVSSSSRTTGYPAFSAGGGNRIDTGKGWR